MALFSLRNIYCLPDAHFQKQGWGMRLHILVFLSQLSFSNPLLWLSPFAYPHRCTHMHKHTHTHTHTICLVYIGIYFYIYPKIYIYTDLNLYLTPLLWSKIEGQQQALLHSEMDLTERLLRGQDLLGRLVLKLSPSPHWWYSGPWLMDHGGPWLIRRECLVTHSLPHTSDGNTNHSSTSLPCPTSNWALMPSSQTMRQHSGQMLRVHFMDICIVRYWSEKFKKAMLRLHMHTHMHVHTNTFCTEVGGYDGLAGRLL